MRYFLAETQIQEVKARCDYLFDIFGLYFIPQTKLDGFIPLVPIGTAEPSITFIIGHQDQVLHFLEDNIDQIFEETLVLVTCMAKTFKPFLKHKKKIYVSIAEDDLSFRYYGKDYGFDFDLTESELDFYNSSKMDIFQRLDSCFQLL